MMIYIIFGIFIHYATAKYNCENFPNVPVKNVTVNSITENIIDSLYINNIQGVEIEDSASIEANVENNYLTIKTIPQFQEYKKNENYAATVIVKCADNNYRLKYNVNYDHNMCHGVKFNRSKYSFRYFQSALQGSELDMGEYNQISVRCVIGFVRFGIAENEYFVLENEGTLTLKALQDIRPLFNKTFQLLAWDDFITHANPRMVPLQIELIGRIRFARSAYYGYIDLDSNVVINNGPIELVTDIDPNYIHVGISLLDYAVLFHIKRVDYTVLLTVSTERELPEDDVLFLDLTCYDIRYPSLVNTTYVKLNMSLSEDELTTKLTTETDIFTGETTSTEATSGQTSDATEFVSVTPSVSTILTSTGFSTIGDTDDTIEETSENTQTSSVSDISDTLTTAASDKPTQSNVHTPLRRFAFWVSNTKTLTIIMIFICGITILSAIIYLKIKILS